MDWSPMTINVSRTVNSGRYKLEKKRKQVQRAESEKIKDVVLGQIEAEKEPFSFLTLTVASAFGAAPTFMDSIQNSTHLGIGSGQKHPLGQTCRKADATI